MAEGEFALMQQHLEAALKIDLVSSATLSSGLYRYYALLVEAAAQQRDPVLLRKYAALAEESATSIDNKLHMAIAYRAWGVAHTLAAEYSQAEAHFNKALEIFTSYPAPWQIGRTLFEMGELARLQMEREQASDYYSRALIAFEELHAAPYAALSRAALENVSRG
jgi:tetratricopeptide (TPR) repeat protein